MSSYYYPITERSAGRFRAELSRSINMSSYAHNLKIRDWLEKGGALPPARRMLVTHQGKIATICVDRKRVILDNVGNVKRYATVGFWEGNGEKGVSVITQDNRPAKEYKLARNDKGRWQASPLEPAGKSKVGRPVGEIAAVQIILPSPDEFKNDILMKRTIGLGQDQFKADKSRPLWRFHNFRINKFLEATFSVVIMGIRKTFSGAQLLEARGIDAVDKEAVKMFAKSLLVKKSAGNKTRQKKDLPRPSRVELENDGLMRPAIQAFLAQSGWRTVDNMVFQVMRRRPIPISTDEGEKVIFITTLLKARGLSSNALGIQMLMRQLRLGADYSG